MAATRRGEGGTGRRDEVVSHRNDDARCCHRPASLNLRDLGLPPSIVECFIAGGVKSGKVYPWQRAAIDTAEDGHNLVYCAPTSGGKSLVAEVLLVRRLVQCEAKGRPGRVLFILPYQSLVKEKEADLKRIVEPIFKKRRNIRGAMVAVRGFAGPDCDGTPMARPLGHPGQEVVAVTTIEKASNAVSRLAVEGRLDELCAVVVDELHMVGEEGRGRVLEAMLTKLRFAARKGRFSDAEPNLRGGAERAKHGLQIIAMSATVSHDSLERLADWLDARLFVTNYRPVPLSEHVVTGNHISIKRKKGDRHREAIASEASHSVVRYTAEDGFREVEAKRPPVLEPVGGSGRHKDECERGGKAGEDSIRYHADFEVLRPVPEILPKACMDEVCVPREFQAAVQLVLEVAVEGHSSLVFCPSRIQAQKVAELLGRVVKAHAVVASQMAKRGRERLKRMLEIESDADNSLVNAVDAGVGFHHAHMSKREKEIVEEGFRCGALHTLACTTTLAAGVNLPARRVLIIENQHGYSTSQYRQMAGRAGRAGQSEKGEAFLFPAPKFPCLRKGGYVGDAVDAAFARVASRLPGLVSQMLEPSTSSPEDNAAVRQEATAKDVGHIAELVLQCIAAGSIRTPHEQFELLQSTFAWSNLSHRKRLCAAMQGALKYLHNDLVRQENRDSRGCMKLSKLIQTVSTSCFSLHFLNGQEYVCLCFSAPTYRS